MKTTHIGQDKLLQLDDGRLFQITQESQQAINDYEWANKVLSNPAVIYPNGHDSHQVAVEYLEKLEDILLDYQVFTV